MNVLTQNYYLDAMGITRWVLRQSASCLAIKEKNSESLVEWQMQQDQSPIIFLAEINNHSDQDLLQAIIQACAKNQKYSTGKLQVEINTAQDFLRTFPQNCQRIVVFGLQQAKLLDPTFTKHGVFSLGAVKICVTHTLQDLNMQANYKRELWQTWKTLL